MNCSNKQFSFLIIGLVVSLINLSVATAGETVDGVTQLSQTEFSTKAQHENTVVIDIRTEREYRAGHIKGAMNLAVADLLADPSKLDIYEDKDLVFYCHSGARVKKLTNHLQAINHPSQNRLFHLKGDMRAWVARRLPVEH